MYKDDKTTKQDLKNVIPVVIIVLILHNYQHPDADLC